jgi:hypothetical protein
MNLFRHPLRFTVRRSLAIWTAALTVLSGCATSSAIQRLGESESNFKNPPQLNSHSFPATDVYRVYEKGATGFDTLEAIRTRLEVRIQEFADRMGKTFVVLGEQSSHPPFILGNIARLEIVFALADRSATPDGATAGRQQRLERLERLKALLDSGALNKDEFEREKKRLLAE